MGKLAGLKKALEDGYVYLRATNTGSPISGTPWTMYVEASKNVDAQAELLKRTYGENLWLSKGDDSVDIADIQKDITRALFPERREYMTTAAQLAREAAPVDIVNSAGLWDNQDLTQIVWDRVLEPKGITSVRTPDGLIRFDETNFKQLSDDPVPALEQGNANPALLGATALVSGAAMDFASRRQQKQSYWQQRKQELLDMADAALTYADYPMRGLYGIGSLATGNNLQQAAQIAAQPIEQTTYNIGGRVTDTLSPYVPPEVAAGAGALTHAGAQVFSPF